MIDIFIPRKIGSYFVLPQRILGVDINKRFVHAAQLSCAGNRIVIEKLMQEPIETDQSVDYPQRVASAIKRIIKRADRYDAIRTPLSSTGIVFKQLTLPFTDYEKIKMVVPYEIESSLPFSLADAIVDVIVIATDEEKKSSTVLVAATQKALVQETLSYFQLAGVEPQAVTVDVFDIYGLYMMMPSLSNLSGSVVLIDVGQYMTRIMLIIDRQLKLIRTVPKGVVTIARSMANLLNISPTQALEELLRFGFEKHDGAEYYQSVTSGSADFWQTVQFTLQSFSSQISSGQIDHIILMGSGCEIAGMRQYAANFLKHDVTIFDPHALLNNKAITIKQGQRIEQDAVHSLAAALPSPITSDINLRQAELAPSTANLFLQQFLTAAILAFSILAGLIGYSWWQTSSAAKKVKSSEREVVRALQDLQLTDAMDLQRAESEAAEKVQREEELWFAFSRQTRFSFLKALQELSSAIDRDAIGLKLRKLVITPNALLFEGEVKDFNALKVLERELRESNLFIIVPTMQELKINEKFFFKKNGTEQ
ncbi:pilus assembly protein PilM [Candidatus Dependentiae bacterium]|nr:pilus assembly protein PilM [Candidatus Dependentiae bacterium]